MTIKHLVISGGGATGFLTYGAASYLARANFWSLSTIESIYGCSIGGYMGVIFSLGYDWEWLDDYFIKRPWDKVIVNTTISLIDVYQEKGLINEHFFTEAIVPLLKAKDLNEHTTLEELYAFNHIDIHIYTTNINTIKYEKIDLSYKTHPTLSIIKALRMTMAFPILFQPVFDGDACYVDGGILNNFPLNDCLSQTKCNRDEVLAFKNIWTTYNNNISEQSSMVDFLLMLIKKMKREIDTEPLQEEVKYTVQCIVEELSDVSKWIEALSSKEMRQKYIDKGGIHAKLFLAYLKTLELN
jgi:predicted acylesterase/phospholipase RssA